jgi:uncharacterized protein YfkK (UPF0435 family)
VQGLASAPSRVGNFIGNTGTWLAEKVTGKTLPKTGIPTVPKILQPQTPSQKAGYATEQIGEFLWPTGMASKATQITSKILPKIATGSTKLDKVIQGVTKMGGQSIAMGGEFAGKQAIQSPDDLNKIKESGIIGAATPPIISGIASAAKKIAPAAASVLAEMIGKEPEHVIRAFKNPVIVAKKMAEKTIPLQVREKAVNTLNSYRSKYLQNFGDELEAIQKSSIQKIPETLGTRLKSLTGQPMANVKNSVKTFVQDQADGLPNIFRKMGVSVRSGAIDTSKSAIVKPTEIKNLQAVFDTIKSQTDFSPKGMQATAARINALTDFVEGDKTLTSAIISQIHELYSNAIKKSYPALAKLRQSFAASKEIANGIDDVLRSTKNEIANPTAVTSATKKLSNIFAEDNDAYLKALKRLEEVSGVDLLNDLAASEFRNLMPRRLTSVLGQASAIAGGIYWSNPLILAVLPLFSPKFVGKSLTTAGKLSPFIKPTTEGVIKSITSLIK